MKTFEFCIIASGLDPQDEAFEARFYDGGCDDATVSFQRGRIILDFSRRATSIAEAIISAVTAVRAVGATIERVEPDPLVSLSDIAARSRMTRAAITQYAKGQRGSGFPPPVARVTSESPLYDWSSVARWLSDNGKVTREEAVVADIVSAANLALFSGEAAFASAIRQRIETVEFADAG